MEDEIILRNPLDTVNKKMMPRKTPTDVPHLTIEEVNRIKATETPYTEVKAAYLFSCFTGLRFADIRRLMWGCVHGDNDNDKILDFIQQKTGKQQILPLLKQDLDLLAGRKRTKDSELIFDLPQNCPTNRKLRRIAVAAGINGKKATFHTGRHTFATLLRYKDVPLPTIQDMLGHSDIGTTLIYAPGLYEKLKADIHKLDDII